MIELSDYEHIQLEELQKPKNGYVVMMNKWWSTFYGKALFYNRKPFYSPQCNSNEKLAEHLSLKGTTTTFVEVAYVHPKCFYE